mmetsp:Transcript_7450/g.22641  ORF Transcript_7450/g.22641 Transcript_7450/m.22641 type:complete len:270 (-) Transcript_7450:95-904(-)|eukprot:CAMPEP_0198732478 /NCGR_PEP_ID=MMETSP1475-20131203/36178_1 /TAXON_ID= ORGANISM="Unidentified sp., Strain CCMP1999" /NCGR_SAMPLE_ID=MMETSP1475 /ASSEMBLY_ACC=CAM_ASM_001111 /LENGTH=269 /DNA_ID=CAMNT_0044495609 /DNA_START=47 /DNA_END=856 /DNA_ORIENTATION=-
MEEEDRNKSPRRGGKRSIREFHVFLTIHKLIAVPCTNAKFSCRWKVPKDYAKPSFGDTEEVLCGEQDVNFNHESDFLVRIRSEAGAREYLMSCTLQIEVRSNDIDPSDRVVGVVSVDLSMFAGIGKRTNRYLLQDSKCNGMLEISLWLRQTFGDNIFLPPRSKPTASVIGSAYKPPQSTTKLPEISTSRRGKQDKDNDRNALLEQLPEIPRELSEKLFMLRYHEELPAEVVETRGDPIREVDQIFRDLHRARASKNNRRELDPRMFQVE